MSNPRKFGNLVLFRVTDATSLEGAKRKAAKIRRKYGIKARVDIYKSGFAVWAEESVKIRDSMPYLYSGVPYEKQIHAILRNRRFGDRRRKPDIYGGLTSNKYQACLFAQGSYVVVMSKSKMLRANKEMFKVRRNRSFFRKHPLVYAHSEMEIDYISELASLARREGFSDWKSYVLSEMEHDDSKHKYYEEEHEYVSYEPIKIPKTALVRVDTSPEMIIEVRKELKKYGVRVYAVRLGWC